jgi:hypothetical protein
VQTPKTLEEGVAALAEALDDRDLNAAVEGKYGPEIRLLVMGEKARRATGKAS